MRESVIPSTPLGPRGQTGALIYEPLPAPEISTGKVIQLSFVFHLYSPDYTNENRACVV